MTLRLRAAAVALCVLAPACQDFAIQHYNQGIDAIERGDTSAAVTINGARVSPQGFIAITERLSGLMAGTKSRRDTMRPSSKG